MRSKLAIILLLILSHAALSFETVQIGESGEASSVRIISSDIDRSVIEYSFADYSWDEVSIGGKKYKLLQNSPKESMIMDAGYPQLPRINRSLLIPDNGIMGYEIISSEYIELTDVDIAPSKGHLLRSVDAESVLYTFNEVYDRNEFFPRELITLGKPYIVRDYRGVVVELNAFQYNPVSRTLRIYIDVTIEIRKTGGGGENTLVRNRPLNKIDPQFEKMYRRHFANSSLLDYPVLLEPGGMLVICYDNFMDEMNEFVDWKIQKGIPTEMVPVSEAGDTPRDIKNYIYDYYNNNDLTYVLLVGDAAQIPTFSAEEDSDPVYTQLIGNDDYPDIFIGRFSAENAEQVITQVNRTIDYEKYPDPAGEWYDKGLGIASTEGPFPEHYGEYDFTHITNIAYKLLDHTYTQIDSSYDPWCSMQPTLDIINDGRSIIFYTGHGGPEGWGTSGISTAEVFGLVNTNMLPHVNSVACNTGQFVEYTCLGESWLRATHETTGEPTGGIGFYGSVQGMTGAPPLDMQDEAVDVLVADSMLTLGGICFSGSMLMMDNYPFPDVGPWEFANLTVFGDPSVSLRGGIPFDLTVSHNPEIITGAEVFSITATGIYGPVRGLNVCGMNEEAYSAGITNSSGQVTLNFEGGIENAGVLLLTVSGGDAVPYIVEIPVIEPGGGYVVCGGGEVEDDLTGNGNGQWEFFETVELGVTFENGGSANAEGCWGIVTSGNEFATIDRDSVWIGDLSAGETVEIERSFEVSLNPGLADGEPVIFDLEVMNGVSTWESQFSIAMHAPKAGFFELMVDDSAGGNGDSILAAGETADFTVTLQNTGSCIGESIAAVLTCAHPFITIISGEADFADIEVGRFAQGVFTVSAAPGFSPPGTVVEFLMEVTGDHGYADETDFNTAVGEIIAAPTGPDDYGYSGYDVNDYPFFTQYNWIELVPDSGGTGHQVPFTNIDQVYHIALPFDFQYYGISYDSLTVTTPGHICMGVTNEIDYTNSSIPDPDGPPAMISPVWGDLDPAGATVGGDAGGVWYEYDSAAHTFVIEYNYTPWYAMAYGDHTTYEIILYDPQYYQTTTGDGQIKLQFKVFEAWGPTGIENYNEDIGLQYRNGNIYPATAAPLEDETAIMFCTPPIFQDVTFTLTPLQSPIIIPAEGGTFDYDLTIENEGTDPAIFDGWIDLTLPDGSYFGPLLLRQSVVLEPGSVLTRTMTQSIPAHAPEGQYLYHGYAGNYPGLVFGADEFIFEKTGVDEGSGYSGGWDLEGWDDGGLSITEVLPENFELKQNYPNPFNPSTTIAFGLPVTSEVELKVYDIQGREVANLAQGYFQAGYYQETFDGANLSSGVYFVRMKAANYNHVRKMLLIK